MLAIFGASWKLVFTPLTKKIRRLGMLKGQILELGRMINLAPIQRCEQAAPDIMPRMRIGEAGAAKEPLSDPSPEPQLDGCAACSCLWTTNRHLRYAPMPPQFDREMPQYIARLREFLNVERRIVEGDQRHSSTPQHRKGRRQSPSKTGAVGDRAKAGGLGASAREACGDVGHAPDVAGSQSPISPAARERRRNNPARTALGARSPGCGVDAHWLWTADGPQGNAGKCHQRYMASMLARSEITPRPSGATA